jgi:hypothetical protein
MQFQSLKKFERLGETTLFLDLYQMINATNIVQGTSANSSKQVTTPKPKSQLDAAPIDLNDYSGCYLLLTKDAVNATAEGLDLLKDLTAPYYPTEVVAHGLEYYIFFTRSEESLRNANLCYRYLVRWGLPGAATRFLGYSRSDIKEPGICD